MQSTDDLDAEELLHLAIQDSKTGRHDAAVVKLKRAVAADPKNANAHFILAAEHAEIGLLDRAIDGFHEALSLNPDLSAARFQLGLIHYVKGDLDQARLAWKDLDLLGAESMRLFKDGLLSVSDGDMREAKRVIEQAIQSESSNQALIADMRRVLAQVESQLTSTSSTSVTADGDKARSMSSILAKTYDAASNEEEPG